MILHFSDCFLTVHFFLIVHNLFSDYADGYERINGPSRALNRFLKKNVRQKAATAHRDHALHTKIFIWVFFLSLVYTGCREVLLSGAFFERGIAETLNPTVAASCILRWSSLVLLLSYFGRRVPAATLHDQWSCTWLSGWCKLVLDFFYLYLDNTTAESKIFWQYAKP